MNKHSSISLIASGSRPSGSFTFVLECLAVADSSFTFDGALRCAGAVFRQCSVTRKASITLFLYLYLSRDEESLLLRMPGGAAVAAGEHASQAEAYLPENSQAEALKKNVLREV